MPLSQVSPARPAAAKRAASKAKGQRAAVDKDGKGEAGAVQRERARLAQLLHDTTCQELTGVYLLASVAVERCRAQSPEAAQQLTQIADLIQQTGAGLAATVQSLRGA